MWLVKVLISALSLFFLSCVCRRYKLFTDHVTEKEEEFEEKLWKWQEFQNEMDSCFRNLAVIEKSLDFQSSFDDAELEDRAETHLVSCTNLILLARQLMSLSTL